MIKVSFLTETNYFGKWPEDFPNARTEVAWQIALNADHYNIYQYSQVKGYDAVFVIMPKGITRLNAVGVEMETNISDKDMAIYSTPIIEVLKSNNKKVCYVQEGPVWFFNDYTLPNQFHFYNQLSQCDIIFAHNRVNTAFYKGLFPGIKVSVIPTLMIDTLVKDVVSKKENKVMIGGNFCRWYGGFQSYIIADIFQECEKWTQTSHCLQPGEDQIPDLKHLPRLMWKEWMESLSTFRYAVHLMPTVAAGTFSLNCAYFGIPCIGNTDVDTQSQFFPDISVRAENLFAARLMAENIYTDKSLYDTISEKSIALCKESHYCDRKKWIDYMEEKLSL